MSKGGKIIDWLSIKKEEKRSIKKEEKRKGKKKGGQNNFVRYSSVQTSTGQGEKVGPTFCIPKIGVIIRNKSNPEK